MTTLVVDASVLVEFASPTRAGAAATELVSHPNADLVAPDLVLLETASALRKLVLREAIDPSDADALISHLPRLVTTVSCGELLASSWEHRGTLSPYDAAYVALAQLFGSALVTLDKRLARAGRSIGIVTGSPSDNEILGSL